jgi:hypothetical protein
MDRYFLSVFGALAVAAAPVQAQETGEPFFDEAKAGAQLRSLYFKRGLAASE